MDNEFDKINRIMNGEDPEGTSPSDMIREAIDSQSGDMLKLIKEIDGICHGHTLFSGSMACAITCAMILNGGGESEQTNLEMLDMIHALQKDIVKNKMFGEGE